MTAIAEIRQTRAPRLSAVELMSLDQALALGEAPWESLRAQRRNTSAFASWAWHGAWAASAPDEERANAFAIATFGADGTIQSMLPLATRQISFRRTTATALTWAIGDFGCPDHLDALTAPGVALDDVAAMLDTLEWDVIQLDGLSDQAIGARMLQAALEAKGITTVIRTLWPCPYIELPRTWAAYLDSRSTARRDVIARRERTLAKRGRMAVTFYGADSLDEGWTHLTRLHDRRWDGDGVFDARLRALHRQFARTLAASDRAWLSTIDFDGEPISAWYGFADEGTLHFYQAGRSPDWNKFSVGGVHIGMMIHRAIARGLERFDFLRGDEPYKAEWTSSHRFTYQLLAFRRSTRGRILRFADRLSDARARLGRRSST